MNVALCSVGDEIVSGLQVDTNAAWLAERVGARGHRVVHHVAVGDDEAAIEAAVRWLAGRADVVVVGGGLGPTSDDRTREGLARAAGVGLVRDPSLEKTIRARFERSGSTMAPSNLRQARVPEGAHPYAPAGTAPGFRMRLGGATVHALPGVPWELREMFEREVQPTLTAAGGGRATRVLHVTGRGESRTAERVDEVVAGLEGVTVAYLAVGAEVQVRLTAVADEPDAAQGRVDGAVEAARAALGDAVAAVDAESLESVVVGALRRLGATVAVAESATAGRVSARLADVPGASAVLRGGAVVYATSVKHDVLGVDEELLARHGPVSREVTAALATRVRTVFDADWGVGVTGVAGPEPQGGRAVGEVVWAVADADRVDVHEAAFNGDRDWIRTRLATAALDGLRRRVQERGG